jgi:hypothetical protein
MVYRIGKVTPLDLRKDGKYRHFDRVAGLAGYQKCKQANLIEDKEGCRTTKRRYYDDLGKARRYAKCMVGEGRMRGIDRRYVITEDYDICGKTYYTVHRTK